MPRSQAGEAPAGQCFTYSVDRECLCFNAPFTGVLVATGDRGAAARRGFRRPPSAHPVEGARPFRTTPFGWFPRCLNFCSD